MNETVYVVWLRTRPYVAAKKVNGVTVQRYWINAIESDEIFVLREQIEPKEYASGRRAKTIIISTRADNIEIVR